MNFANNQVLIIDDEKGIRDSLCRILKSAGYGVMSASNGDQAINKIREVCPALALLDIKMPGMDGMETLSEIRKFNDELPVIILTAYGNIKNAITASRLGIYDYITKPFKQNKIKSIIHEVMKKRESGKLREGLVDIIGSSSRMQEVYDLIEKAASADITTVLRGESGTGKELAAQAIHRLSPRKKGPFIPIDVASLPDTLVESELFGHEKGAFTGAGEQKPGKFELAQGGTVFLDEVGNLNLDIQAKLLRVIEQQEIQRVGGRNIIKLDVRFIFATNLDLEKAVLNGSFRQDLYYRINVFPIMLPSLRERKNDIPVLFEHFLKKCSCGSNQIKRVSEKVRRIFMNYNWPGNVRELKNVIESSALLADDEIKSRHLPSYMNDVMVHIGSGSDTSLLKDAVEKEEKRILVQALEKFEWNKAQAARELGIDYKTIYNKVKRYGIENERQV